MIFKLNFRYKENVEYLLSIYSNWYLEGEGTWEVDADDFIEELRKSKEEIDSIEDAIENYLWLTLDRDIDCIEFNKKDFNSLIEYIKENYNEI